MGPRRRCAETLCILRRCQGSVCCWEVHSRDKGRGVRVFVGVFFFLCCTSRSEAWHQFAQAPHKPICIYRGGGAGKRVTGSKLPAADGTSHCVFVCVCVLLDWGTLCVYHMTKWGLLIRWWWWCGGEVFVRGVEGHRQA